MSSHIAVPLTALSTAIDRLSENAVGWGSQRTIDEGLDIVRDYCWAGSCALYDARSGDIRLIGHRPALENPSLGPMPPSWFPWGLAPMNPRRFVFIEDAGLLSGTPDGTVKLADLGVQSCVHLPLMERDRPLGFLQVFWHETRLVWDDEMGRVLRTLGRLLIESADRG